MVSTIAQEAPPRRGLLLSMGSLLLCLFLAAVDQTVVATATPTIVAELNGLENVSWLVTAFSLASGIVAPLYGKLSDMYGRRRLYLSAIALFLAGSALCGLAQTMAQLIAFRAFQGIGAGGLMVLTLAISADIATPRERAKFQGLFGAVIGVAAVLGPVIGGYLTEHVSWRWIFYINLPLGAVALAVAFAVLRLPRRTSPHRIDWPGAALISGVLTCLTLFASWGGTTYAWTSPVVVGLGVGAVVLAGLFVLVERRAKEPVLPLGLFRDRTLTIATATIVLMATGMVGAATFLPLYLQLAAGASASNSGLLLLPLMAGMIAASAGAGRVVTRLGTYKWVVVTGAALATAAAFLFSTMGPATGAVTSGLYMVLFGVGLGMVLQNLMLAVQVSAPAADRGAATSVVSFARNVGGAVGVAVLGGVFSGRLGQAALASGVAGAVPESVRPAFAEAVTGVFGWITPVMLAGVVLLACLPNVRLHRDA